MSNALLDRMFAQGASNANSEMRFAHDNVLQQLAFMRPDELDALAFGAVRVDDAGDIQAYNKGESDISGVPQSEALGKNFFKQLAPCTNNSLFMGAFRRGVSGEELNVIFPYTFTYKMKPTNVFVHLYRESRTGTNWILVKKR